MRLFFDEIEVIKYWGFDYKMTLEEQEKYNQGKLLLVHCPQKVENWGIIGEKFMMPYEEAKQKYGDLEYFKNLNN